MSGSRRGVMSDTSVGNKKIMLWRLLKQAFLKARENVRQKSGVAVRVPSPEHFAINVLNEHYGKRKSAKPRNYTAEELDHAVAVSQSHGFLKALEHAISEVASSRQGQPQQPETQAVHKVVAKQHPEAVKHPETKQHPESVKPAETKHLQEAPKTPESRELRRVREEIERLGGEVRNIKSLGIGRYEVEVATPLSVYCDKGTEEEILRQVERDVATSRAG